jgi:hypothetical protein
MGIQPPGVERMIWIRSSAIPQFRPGETVPYQVYTTFDDVTSRFSFDRAGKRTGGMG